MWLFVLRSKLSKSRVELISVDGTDPDVAACAIGAEGGASLKNTVVVADDRLPGIERDLQGPRRIVHCFGERDERPVILTNLSWLDVERSHGLLVESDTTNLSVSIERYQPSMGFQVHGLAVSSRSVVATDERNARLCEQVERVWGTLTHLCSDCKPIDENPLPTDR